MDKKNSVVFKKHAYDQFEKTSLALGLKSSPEVMKAVFAKATLEKSKCPNASFNLLKRNVLRGSARYYVADGWRFVVAGNNVVTVERVKSHENHKYQINFIPRHKVIGKGGVKYGKRTD